MADTYLVVVDGQKYQIQANSPSDIDRFATEIRGDPSHWSQPGPHLAMANYASVNGFPTMPALPSQRPNLAALAAGLGITLDQAKSQGIQQAVQSAQGFGLPSAGDIRQNRQSVNQQPDYDPASLSQITAQQAQVKRRAPTPTALDSLLGTPGTSQALAQMPGFRAGLASAAGGMIEPDNLAMMAGLAFAPPAVGMLAGLGFAGQAAPHVIARAKAGDIGGALGEALPFLLPAAMHGGRFALDKASVTLPPPGIDSALSADPYLQQLVGEGPPSWMQSHGQSPVSPSESAPPSSSSPFAKSPAVATTPPQPAPSQSAPVFQAPASAPLPTTQTQMPEAAPTPATIPQGATPSGGLPDTLAPIQTPPQLDTSTPTQTPGGPSGTVYTPTTNRPVPFEYRIVPGSDLIPSHTDRMTENPGYDQSLQPRDRKRIASEAQVARIAQKLTPERVAQSSSTAEGAPIVGPDNMVESGNARALGILRAYSRFPERAEAYRQWLSDNAGQFGLDPNAVNGVKNPVLVRSRQGELSPADRAQLADEMGRSPVSTMSATETAVNDGQALVDSGLIGRYVPNSEGNIGTAANRPFVREFVRQVAGEEAQSDMLQADGQLSANGERRIRNAILASAYPDTTGLERMLESTDNNSRQVASAMLTVAPRYARMRAGINSGDLHDLDIAPDITAAANKLSELRDAGMPVASYLAQRSIFDPGLSPEANELLQIFERNKRSGAKIAQVLSGYADLVEAQGSPRQQSMLGGPTLPTKLEIIEASRRVAGDDNATVQPAGDLFAAPSAPGEGSPGASAPTAPPPGPTGTEGPVAVANRAPAEAPDAATGRVKLTLSRSEAEALSNQAAESSPNLARALDSALTKQRGKSVSISVSAEHAGAVADVVRGTKSELGYKPASVLARIEGAQRAMEAPPEVDTVPEATPEPPPAPTLRETMKSAAERLREEALSDLKGKLTSGVDPTDIPAYAKLAVSYMLDGAVKVGDVYDALKSHLGELTDDAFTQIYSRAVSLYHAMKPDGAPEAESLPYGGEKYVGSHNVERSGYDQTEADRLIDRYRAHEAQFDTQRRGTRTHEETSEAAKTPGVLPADWEKAEPGRAYNAEQIQAIRAGVEAARVARSDAERTYTQDPTEENRSALAAAEATYLRREVARQGASTEAGRALDIHNTEPEAFNPEPAKRVEQLFNPEPRQATNPRAREFPSQFVSRLVSRMSENERGTLTTLDDAIRRKLANVSADAIPGASFLKVVPELTQIGKLYFKAGAREFGAWLSAVREHVGLTDDQGKVIWDKVTLDKGKSSKGAVIHNFAPFPEPPDVKAGMQLSTNDAHDFNGSSQQSPDVRVGDQRNLGLTGVGELHNRQAESNLSNRPAPDMPSVQAGAQLSTNEPHDFNKPFPEAPSVQAGAQRSLDVIPKRDMPDHVETAGAAKPGDQQDIGVSRDMVPDGEYKRSLDRLADLPPRTGDPVREGVRQVQAMPDLRAIGLKHLEDLSNAVRDGLIPRKAMRFKWGERMKADAPTVADNKLLADVWRDLPREAEKRSGMRGEAKDYLRRSLVKGLAPEQVAGLADELSRISPDDPDYYAKLGDLSRRYHQPGLLENTSMFIKAGLLTSPKTGAKIALGHGSFLAMEAAKEIPASIADTLYSAISGQDRQVPGLSVKGLASAARTAVVDGIRDGKIILREGEMGLRLRAKSSEQPYEVQHEFYSRLPLLSAYVNGVFRLHGAVYHALRLGALDYALDAQARLAAGVDVKAGRGEYSDRYRFWRENPSDTMQSVAMNQAEQVTLVNDNKPARFMRAVKHAGGPGVAFAVDRVAPFTRVPANIVLKGSEYAGGMLYGPVKLAYDALLKDQGAKPETAAAMQRNFAQTMGRGAVGASAIALGYMLAKQGKLTGFTSQKGHTDKDGRLTVGSRTYQLTGIEPGAMPLLVGATLAEHRSLGSRTGGAIGGLYEHMPLLEAAHTAADTADKIGKGQGAAAVGSQLGQLSPSILGDLAAQTDTHNRSVKNSPLVGPLEKRVPGWREKLPAAAGHPTDTFFDPTNSRAR